MTWRSNAICITRSTPEDAGGELRAVAREERPTVVLKAWEQARFAGGGESEPGEAASGLRRDHRLMKVREDLFTAGFRPRLATPMLLAILGRLKDRELSGVLSKAGYRSAEIGQGRWASRKRRRRHRRN